MYGNNVNIFNIPPGRRLARRHPREHIRPAHGRRERHNYSNITYIYIYIYMYMYIYIYIYMITTY